MKTFTLTIVALFIAIACHSQPAPGMPPSAPPAAAAVKDTANYLVRVGWKDPKGDPQFLEVLTAEGNFELDTIQKNSVKINDSDIPVTLKLSGTLKVLNDEKGRLQFFLGRTVPYVTGNYSGGSTARASYSQMSVGLNSGFIVKFGKPVVVQNDENGEITVLIKRMAD